MRLKAVLLILLFSFSFHIYAVKDSPVRGENINIMVQNEIKTLSSLHPLEDNSNSSVSNIATYVFFVSAFLYFGIMYYKKKNFGGKSSE